MDGDPKERPNLRARSFPPFLLVFAGHVAPIKHRGNQQGLGGDNVRGSCCNLHPSPVILLHWFGSNKTWLGLTKFGCGKI
jgi:hypothetical protein